MKLIDEIRRDNLALLRDEFGGLNVLAQTIDRDDSQVSQWMQGSLNSGTGKPRGMRSDTARFIETQCGKPVGWLDLSHDAEVLSGLMNHTNKNTTATESTEVTVHQAMAALAGFIYQLDDDARMDAAYALDKLTDNPEMHERAAALFLTAFQSGRKKSA